MSSELGNIVAIVDAMCDVEETCQPFGKRYGQQLIRLSPEHLAALQAGKLLALDDQGFLSAWKKPRSQPMTKPQVLGLPPGYAEWLTQLKGRIAQARQRVTLAANAKLVSLYGQTGREILNRQAEQGWVAKVIDRLGHNLNDAFLVMRGFSTRNLKYMAYFAKHCPEGLIGQQPAAQLPWFHIVTLLTKLIYPTEREPVGRVSVA